ncbi:MAG: hypothetical protein H0X67_17150 [Acidobacteria bacterium]|nr:hypothetical protein [Acidobacteriota bacterium]
MRRVKTPARMARLVSQWQRSGEPAARFARRHGVPTWTFWYWRRKLAGAPVDEPRASAAPAFVPVQVASDGEAWVLEVAFQRGERLQVRAGASADLVRATVAALRTGC